MIACLVAALWGVGAEAFCLTVFFVVWILRIALPVATRWLESDPDTVIYFAPWVSCGEHFFVLEKHPTPDKQTFRRSSGASPFLNTDKFQVASLFVASVWTTKHRQRNSAEGKSRTTR